MIAKSRPTGTPSSGFPHDTGTRSAPSMRQHVANLLYGPEHEYWKLRVAAHLRSSGYEVAIEKPIANDQTIDLVATRSTERLAVEIEAGHSDVLASVRKCVAAGYASIYVLATRNALVSELRNALRSLEWPPAINVSVVDASRFVDLMAHTAPASSVSSPQSASRRPSAVQAKSRHRPLCQRCNLPLYRTRRRGWQRLWGALTGRRMYRCHWCGWRGWGRRRRAHA